MANPILKKLGFSPTDRIVVVHADDIGMCQSTLPAIAELFDFGLVSSAAAMVPCPWFPGVVDIAREQPDIDIGVHLTLNSEWEVYRWGPLTTVDQKSGLVDEEGYFLTNTEATQSHADLSALQLELHTQIQRAREGGIDPTHVDTHMFCLGHPRFFESYLNAGFEGQTLPLVFRPRGPGWRAFDLPEEGPMVAAVRVLESNGIPMIDDIYMMNLDTHQDRLEEAQQAIAALSPGVTHFILHPTIDSPEIRALAPDWRCRVADYETFRREDLREFIKEIGVHIVGYREIRDLIT